MIAMGPYTLPQRQQWVVLHEVVNVLQALHPDAEAWVAPGYTAAGREIVLKAVAKFVTEKLQHVATNPQLADESDISIINVHHCALVHHASLYGMIKSCRSAAEYWDFEDSDSDANVDLTQPSPFSLVWTNLPVRDLPQWEVQESRRIREITPRSVKLSGEPYETVDPLSGNTWAFGPYSHYLYMERSPAMDWALYLRDLCMSRRSGEPVAPNPHGTRSRVSIM